VRCTDVKVVSELTKSSGTNKFKSDFCRMKIKECRDMLERHHLDVARLWTKEPPNVFQFTTGNSERVKMK
ncbi:MAG: hypothetical protein LUH53_07750, partial [Lachnospiraceae bacterium]|nr:hypothetical protein [Lachnospiraceae bacterium]